MDFVFYITATVINKNAYLRHLICTYYLTRLKIYKKALERFFISNFSYLCAVLVIQPLIGGKN